MKVSVVGTGYVGLVSGACLAARGHSVLCIDLDPDKVASINAARAPIHEPGLPELLRRHAGQGLRATADLEAAVAATELTFIAVGTPAAADGIDLRHVERAAAQVGAALRGIDRYHTVIVKSTVIPGTTTGVVRSALEAASGKLAGRDFGLGMNPEFLTEGSAVEDFMNPDRLVFGGVDARTHGVLDELYASFDAEVPRLRTNPGTAEMIKYASNAVLATMISYSNEIARLCAAVGDIDAVQVMQGVHQAGYFTARRGTERSTAGIASFLLPGCGFGGSCLPKDVAALIAQAQGKGLQPALLQSVLAINRGQPDEVMKLIARHYPVVDGRPALGDVQVTVLGIAFKPDTDDVRESPAFPVIARLQAAGARVSAYDPVARPAGHAGLAGVTLATSLEAAVAGAEIVVLVTRWPEFARLAALLQGQARPPLVVDGRRMLDPAAYARYEGIGL